MSCLNGIDSFRLSETDFLTPFRPKLLKAGNESFEVSNFYKGLLHFGRRPAEQAESL